MVSAELISEMSKEFDLDDIDKEQKMVVDGKQRFCECKVIYFIGFSFFCEDLPINNQPDVIVLPSSWNDVVSVREENMDTDKTASSVKVSVT